MRSLVLITDSFPSPNGAGISQTLYNLLSGYPEKIWVVLPKSEAIPTANERLQACIIQYPEGLYRPLQNRLGKYFNPWLHKKYLQNQPTLLLQWIHQLPKAPDCLVVVSTTVGHKLHLAWCLQQQAYTVVPYFMDDWLDGNMAHWKNGSVQQVAADLLRKAPARLMISTHLQHTLEQRYHLPAAPTLVVHNPSPPPIVFPSSGNLGGRTHPHTYFPPSGGTKGGTHTPTIPVNLSTNQPINLIIYAGSIWPMHADALIAVAKAIQLLNASGKKDFSLCIFTSQAHWEKYESMLQGDGVHWGRWLPYAKVREKFSDAWLLLCTASFEKAQQAFTNSSVQTKLTDYIAVGRPVLVVAPKDAASGEWVLNETCGYWLQTRDPAEIATQLQQLAEQPFNWQQKAEKALALASTTYSTAAVQQRLYQFLSAHA